MNKSFLHTGTRAAFILLVLISVVCSCKKNDTNNSDNIIYFTDTMYEYNYNNDLSYEFRDTAVVKIGLKPFGKLSTNPFDSIQLLSTSPIASIFNNYVLPLTECNWCDSTSTFYFLQPINGSYESSIVITRFQNPDSIALSACLGCSLGWSDRFTFTAKK